MVSLLILWPFLYFNRRVFTCNEVVLVINTLLLPFSFFFFKDELKPNFNFFYTYENYWMDIFYLFILMDFSKSSHLGNTCGHLFGKLSRSVI